ncbi:MAG: hypothetical protein HY858_02440 [Candidatus Solibacter usitatus]|nr:hypothetical protein [Candidatus Solibacter usitatus]
MACYISTRQNRFYASLEATYGQAAAMTAGQRFSAVSLKARQVFEKPLRRDKTGTRTQQPVAGELRRRTGFDLTTYLYARETGQTQPRYWPLVQAALGGSPKSHMGGLSVVTVNGALTGFAAAHGLAPGDAVTVGGEIRIVAAVPDWQTAVLSAPLAGPGTTGGALSYGLAPELAGVTLHERWSPAGAAQRMLAGAVVDELEFRINGDFHELGFRGQAADLLDNASFEAGAAGLQSFPAEPAVAELMESPIPGHMGQAWIGSAPGRMYTLSSAVIRLKNNVDLRAKDYGSVLPRCIVPGDREVTVDLEVYSQDGALYDEILQAAKTRTPLPLMVQMGEREGQMCAVWMPNLIPAVPELDNREARLLWRLKGSAAVGTAEDEVYVAFG